MDYFAAFIAGVAVGIATTIMLLVLDARAAFDKEDDDGLS